MAFNAPPPLTITCSRVDDQQLAVTVTGELDLATAPRFEVTLTTILGTSPTEPPLMPRPSSVVIDLSGLRLLSAAGLAVLYRAHERAAANGMRLRIVIGSAGYSPAARVLRISGLDAVLDVYRSWPPAPSGLPPPLL